MNTEDNKRTVIVGIFVFLAVAILVAGVFTLGGQQKRFESTITLNALFDNVNGLRNGNNIWFSGVKIGTVKKVKFIGDSKVMISMKIGADVQKFIHSDSKVRISSESLIGNKIIEIYGGTPDSPSVNDGDQLAVVNTLNSEDIMKTLQENNKNMLAITTDFKKISGKMAGGEGTMGAILTDSMMAVHFRSVVANLEKVSLNTVKASGALSQFTAKLNTHGGLANEMLTDTMVFSQMKASAAQLSQITTSVKELSNNLDLASKKLNTNNNTMGMLLTDEQFSEKLKSTMENINSSSAKLDENMEAMQHNFLFRGYFKKKAKQQKKQGTYK